MMATAKREAAMKTFFGVREGDVNATDNAWYMPVGGSLGGLDWDNNGKDKKAKALVMQRIEKSCQDIFMDLMCYYLGRMAQVDSKACTTMLKPVGSLKDKKVNETHIPIPGHTPEHVDPDLSDLVVPVSQAVVPGKGAQH